MRNMSMSKIWVAGAVAAWLGGSGAAVARDDGPPMAPMYLTNRTAAALRGTLSAVTNGQQLSFDAGLLTNLNANSVTGTFLGTFQSPACIYAPVTNFPQEVWGPGGATYQANVTGIMQVMTNSGLMTNVEFSLYPSGGGASAAAYSLLIATNYVSPVGGAFTSQPYVLSNYYPAGSLIYASNFVTNITFAPAPVALGTYVTVLLCDWGGGSHCTVNRSTTNNWAGTRTNFLFASTSAGAISAGSPTYLAPSLLVYGTTPLPATNLITALAAAGGSPNAAAVSYAPAASGLAAWNVQGAVDALATNQDAGYAVISLAPTNYAVVGTEANIYYDNVVRSQYPVGQIWPVMNCATGFAFASSFRVWATNTWTGVTPLGLAVSRETNVLASYSGYLKVASAGSGNGVTRKLLLLGDSTTAGSQTCQRLWVYQNTNVFKLTFLGTQGSSPTNHEGYGGWSMDSFYNSTHGSNPFTNGSLVFDFGYYLSHNSFTMSAGDWVVFNLGINDTFGATSDSAVAASIQTFTNEFSLMAANIQSAVSGVRVGLCVTIPPSQSQDAFGANYQGTGAQSYWRYRRNRFLIAETLVKYQQTGVYVWPINGCLDTLNNMQTTAGALNAANSTSVSWMSNGLHPATAGYNQIGDAYWAILKGFEN